jgi:hypothetical protein
MLITIPTHYGSRHLRYSNKLKKKSDIKNWSNAKAIKLYSQKLQSYVGNI